ncbi:MAG TPA: metallophosphoesterase [Anaeromyxobacteraceae bacterium]|nr:metallophosphoesterase [Anaeromyxobacteraceae bacterium]
MHRFGRRDFLRGAAALAAAGAAGPALGASPDVPVAEPHAFAVPGLNPAHQGLKVAQISDVHVGPHTPPERILAAVKEANAFEPDLVALTGDYLSKDRGGVGLVRELLGGLAAPAVAVLGNHDHWVDPEGATAALEEMGYAVLRNQHTTLTLRGEPFTVVGIDDGYTKQADPERALKGAPEGSRLILAHWPTTARQLNRMGEKGVCLSGHTHGGQISLPIVSPLAYLVAGEPYRRGLYHVGGVQLYVNRGVGSSFWDFRVNSPPEVTLATLEAA